MSTKRKLPSLGLQRRVKARREDDWDPETSPPEDSSDNAQVSEEGVDGDEDDSQGSEEEEEGDGRLSGSEADEDSNADGDTAPKVDFSSISFGALARAQASLPSSGRKSKKKDAAAPEEQPAKETARPTKPKKNDPSLKRSSKHAPQEQTSKRRVSRRKFTVDEPQQRKARDPRFDAAVAHGDYDEAKAQRAYAFLNEYRDSEMADLRAQAKAANNPVLKEQLKRQLHSMESRKKSRQRKDERDALLREHRHKEKELVAQGKKPFYLKKSEQKQKLLTDRFASMSKGQVDRAIERKRKKVTGKEKKELGFLDGRRA